MPDIWYPNVSFPAGETAWAYGGSRYLNVEGSGGIGSRAAVSFNYADATTALACMHTHVQTGAGDTWPNSVWAWPGTGSCGVPVGTHRYRTTSALEHEQVIDQDFFGWTANETWIPRHEALFQINNAYGNLLSYALPTQGGANLYNLYGGNPYGTGSATSWYDVATPTIDRLAVQDTAPWSKVDIWGQIIRLRIPTLGLTWASVDNVGSGVSASVELRWDVVSSTNELIDDVLWHHPIDGEFFGTLSPWNVVTSGSVIASGIALSGADSSLKWSTSDVIIPLNFSRAAAKAIFEGTVAHYVRIEARLLSDTLTDYVPGPSDFTSYAQSLTSRIAIPDGAWWLVKPENVDVLYTVDAIPDLAGDLTGERQRFS